MRTCKQRHSTAIWCVPVCVGGVLGIVGVSDVALYSLVL